MSVSMSGVRVRVRVHVLLFHAPPDKLCFFSTHYPILCMHNIIAYLMQDVREDPYGVHHHTQPQPEKEHSTNSGPENRLVCELQEDVFVCPSVQLLNVYFI